jgi:hypothetical protein
MDIFNFVSIRGIFIMEKSLNSSIPNSEYRKQLMNMFKRQIVINPAKEIHSYGA